MTAEAEAGLAALDVEDLRLLRAFRAVVDHGGFAPAQAALGISAASLSTQIGALENLLGVRLCERGRSGFRVTEPGRQVFELAQHLFHAVDTFRSELGELRSRLVGVLRIGMVDNLVTNTDAALDGALDRFLARGTSVQVKIGITDPAGIERGLADGSLDVGIAVFQHRLPSLRYFPLFEEEQGLYCGDRHPAFARAPDRLRVREISEFEYVARGYMGGRKALSNVRFNAVAAADNMEAIALLVLSGRFIGHLPVHYAAQWVATGRMRPLLPGHLNYKSLLSAAVPKGPPRTAVIEAFLEDLLAGRPSSKRLPARRQMSLSAAGNASE